MVKTIIREIIITILIIVVIGLGLSILLYDYIPSAKVIPANVVAYDLPDEIKNEIANSTVASTENIVRTYSIDAQDLEVYEYTNTYDKGKENPFAIGDYEDANSTTDNSTTNNSTSSNTTSNGEYKGK